MIFFDWKKVHQKGERSTRKILDIIYYLTYKPIPYDKLDKMFYIGREDYTGDSFLINPHLLFENRKKHLDRHIVEYIGFASLRNYADYVITGNTSLALLACLGKENIINNNSLLHIENQKIRFLYEEVTPKRKIK